MQYLDQPDVKETLEKMHVDFVFVSADKAASIVIVVYKKYYYIETLVKELGINTTSYTSSAYIPYTDSLDEILKTVTILSTPWVWKYLRKTEIFHICAGPQNYIRNKYCLITGFDKWTTKSLLIMPSYKGDFHH